MWPNDADGNAIRRRLGPLLKKAGYTIVDPGAYTDGTNDYSVADRHVQGGGLRDLQHLPDPARLRHVLAAGRPAGLQAEDRARSPRPGCSRRRSRRSAPSGSSLASAAYWTPTYPYTSSLTERRLARQLADGYQTAAGKQWNQQLGPSLALFDVANAALKATADPKDKAAVAERDRQTLEVDTPIGKLEWGKGREHLAQELSGCGAGAGEKIPERANTHGELHWY